MSKESTRNARSTSAGTDVFPPFLRVCAPPCSNRAFFPSCLGFIYRFRHTRAFFFFLLGVVVAPSAIVLFASRFARFCPWPLHCSREHSQPCLPVLCFPPLSGGYYYDYHYCRAAVTGATSFSLPGSFFFSLPVRPFPRDEMLTAVDGPGIKPQSPRATGSAVERCQPQITRG